MNFALAVAWLVICGIVAGAIAPAEPNGGFKDSAAAIAFIGLVAVAIERGIEGMFAVLSSRLGQWWPLSVVKAEFDTFERQTGEVLGSVTTRTLEELRATQEALSAGDRRIGEIQRLIDEVDAARVRLQAQFDDATAKLVPGSDRLARVGEISTAMSATLHRVHATAVQSTTEAQGLLRTAGDITDRASMIIASFQDNPARRVASLVIGAGLGMLIAGGVGLNVFVATLGAPADPNPAIPAFVAGSFGVILTGLLIGLGSAPTHEVVKSLQAYKVNRTGPVAVANIAPGTGTGAGTIPGVVQEGVITEGVIQEAFGAGAGARAGLGAPAQLNVRHVRSTS